MRGDGRLIGYGMATARYDVHARERQVPYPQADAAKARKKEQ